MLERGILKPVLPEIPAGAWESVALLASSESEARIAADPLRRLSALLPRDTGVAAAIAARLKLSNRARKLIFCAADQDIGQPRAAAYRAGTECAVDRLLLAGHSAEAREILAWAVPRLRVTGGALIKRGLEEGPVVSRTLRRIEDRWIEAGFPGGEGLESIVSEVLAEALR
jgi:poly(A) polymerase